MPISSGPKNNHKKRERQRTSFFHKVKTSLVSSIRLSPTSFSSEPYPVCSQSKQQPFARLCSWLLIFSANVALFRPCSALKRRTALAITRSNLLSDSSARLTDSSDRASV